MFRCSREAAVKVSWLRFGSVIHLLYTTHDFWGVNYCLQNKGAPNFSSSSAEWGQRFPYKEPPAACRGLSFIGNELLLWEEQIQLLGLHLMISSGGEALW